MLSGIIESFILKKFDFFSHDDVNASPSYMPIPFVGRVTNTVDFRSTDDHEVSLG